MLSRFFAVAVVTWSVGISTADAQPRRLSQIDFDRPSLGASIVPAVTDPGSINSRARLDDPASLQQPQSLLVPILRGVKTDSRNESAITSTGSWAAQSGTYCELMKGDTEECNSARSLRDVLRRFTGNDEFFKSQCPSTCRSPADVPVLKDLQLVDGETKLRKVLDGGSCSFQLTKPFQSAWKVGQVLRTECTCVPKSCLAD